MNSADWSGILVDTNGYPMKSGGWFYIGGGQDYKFKVTDVEFYGVKTQIDNNSWLLL